MRAYWQLTAAQLRIFVRNRQAMFWTLFFPIFFMLMFGFLFGNGNSYSVSGYLIDQDHSVSSQQLEQALMKQPFIKFKSTSDMQASMKSLKQGGKQVLVVIPSGYGGSLQKAESEASGGKNGKTVQPVPFKVYYDQTNKLKSEQALMAVSQIADALSKKIVDYQPVVVARPLGVQSLDLKYIDFLIPGILAMMIMNTNLNGVAGQISSWRERGILRRMQSTPLKASTFIAAQITARLVLNGLQALIVLIIGYFGFGTQVNGSWLLLIGFVIVGTLTFMSIGFIIAGLAKNPESAGPIAGFISFPLMFLGGVFFSIDSMPKALQPFVKLLPITHLTTALRQIMNVGAGLPELWQQGALLLGWMVVAFIIASFTFRWE